MTGWNIDLPSADFYELGDIQTRPAAAHAFQQFVNALHAQRNAGIDTETTGLTLWKDVPLYWSVAWPNYRATLHANTLHLVMQTCNTESKGWVMANAKYDTHMLANVGIELKGRLIDTQVQHALLYEDKPHGLKYMAKQLLGWTYGDFQDQFGKIGKNNSAADVIYRAEQENKGLLIEYAANDAWATWQVFEELEQQLMNAKTFSLFNNMAPYINTLHDLFHKVEVRYTRSLWNMERNGIRVNREHLEKAEPKARQAIVDLEKEINKTVGYVLNPKSPAQLQDYFFNRCQYKPWKFSSGGKSGVKKPSTDESVIKSLAEQQNDKVAKLILQHREYTKLHGTYIVGLHDLLDNDDRIHTRFNQDVARTGRLSSSEPNLQNIPRAENDQWQLRSAFIPSPGNVIIAVDYEQLEMRLLASAAGEEDMINIFKRKWDIHMGNASLMFNVPYDDLQHAKKVDKMVKSGELPESDMTEYVLKCLDYRSAAKAIGFGLNYGMGAGRLAGTLGITREEAEDKIEQYKATYPAVTQFYAEAIEETYNTGYAFTILGRRRNVPEIRSYRNDERAFGERVAVNTQIQGSAADVCKMAQINLTTLNLYKLFGCRELLQVHDELVFECPRETVERALPCITDIMEHPFTTDLPVHLAVDANYGESWGAAK